MLHERAGEGELFAAIGRDHPAIRLLYIFNSFFDFSLFRCLEAQSHGTGAIPLWLGAAQQEADPPGVAEH